MLKTRLGQRDLLALFLASSLGINTAAATEHGDEGDQIIITGSRTEISRDMIGQPVTILDSDLIAIKDQTYLADLLRQVPGLAVNRTGGPGGLTQLRLWGGEANQLLVLLDGVDISSAGQGEVDFSSLLLTNIDRVEILKGGASGLYGANALSGVINIITKSPKKSETEGRYEYGSAQSQYGQLGGALVRPRGFISATIARQQSDGFNAALQGDERDGVKLDTGFLRGQWQITDPLRLDGWLRKVNKFADIDGFDFTGGPLQGLAIDEDSFNHFKDFNAALSATLSLNDDLFVTRLHLARASTDFTGGSNGTAFYGTEDLRETLSLQSSFVWKQNPRTQHRITLFIDQKRESFRNIFPSDPSQIARLSRHLTGLGIEYRGQYGRHLFLNGSLRQEYNDAFKDALTGSVNGAWRLPERGLRLHANYGSAVTNPTFYEQFGFTPGLFVGNPNLKPERGDGLSVGIEKSFSQKAIFDVTFFQNHLKDEIRSQFPSVVNDQGTSKRRGVAVEARLAMTGGELRLAYTNLDASEADGSREVKRPSHQANMDWLGSFGKLNYSASLTYNGRMVDNDFRNFFTNGFVASKTPLNSYWLGRISGSYPLTDQVQLFGRVENLFDSDYQEVIGYNTPGRTAYLGLRFRF